MHNSEAKEVLRKETKYVLDNRTDDVSIFEVSRMYDDMRGACGYEEDQWVQDRETLFTAREILELFTDIC